jgi:ubiquinone/menaquinone biosynthesis C-methylase UbiE
LPPDKRLQVWNESAGGSVAQLLSGIPHQPSWKVLEIGCGIGRLIKPLREMFAEVDGVDIADNMIRFGEQYLSDSKGKGRLAKNNGCDLAGFDDAGYDYVYSTIVFQHIRSLSVVQRYLREIFRVLKPGGFFRLQVHDTTEANFGAFDGEANPRLQYEMFGNAYTPDQLRVLLAEHGYDVQDVTHTTPWIWATARRRL